MSPYLQIGTELFPVDQNGSIGFIEYGSHPTADNQPYRIIDYIAVTTNVLVSDGEVSVSHKVEYEIGSPEADALIGWLSTNVQVQLSLESDEVVSEETLVKELTPATLDICKFAIDCLRNQITDGAFYPPEKYEIVNLFEAQKELLAMEAGQSQASSDLGDLDDNPF